MSYSAWLAATASKEFTIRAGLEAVADFESEQGAFSAEEIAEADQRALQALARSRRSITTKPAESARWPQKHRQPT